MTQNELNQAYVIGTAARGILRCRAIQKQAMMKQAAGDTIREIESPLAAYSQSIGMPAGLGAILGAIIQGARGKSILNGLLIGGGAGGLAGLGHQLAYDFSDDYAKNNPFSNGYDQLVQALYLNDDAKKYRASLPDLDKMTARAATQKALGWMTQQDPASQDPAPAAAGSK